MILPSQLTCASAATLDAPLHSWHCESFGATFGGQANHELLNELINGATL